jgi:hypothetical protein
VCEEAKENNAELQCPVQEGTYTIEQTVQLPREIPPGECSGAASCEAAPDSRFALTAKFNVHVNGATQDDEPLLCLDLSVSLPLACAATPPLTHSSMQIDFMHHR